MSVNNYDKVPDSGTHGFLDGVKVALPFHTGSIATCLMSIESRRFFDDVSQEEEEAYALYCERTKDEESSRKFYQEVMAPYDDSRKMLANNYDKVPDSGANGELDFELGVQALLSEFSEKELIEINSFLGRSGASRENISCEDFERFCNRTGSEPLIDDVKEEILGEESMGEQFSVDNRKYPAPKTTSRLNKNAKEFVPMQDLVSTIDMSAVDSVVKDFSDLDLHFPGEKDALFIQREFNFDESIKSYDWKTDKLGNKSPMCYYDKSMTSEQICFALHGGDVLVRTATNMGYPAYIVNKLIAKFQRAKRFVFGQGSAHRTPVIKGYDKQFMSNHWKIPFTQNTKVILKPSSYSRSSFIEWAKGQAKSLSVNLRKNQFATGNLACQLLYYNRGVLRLKEVQTLFEKSFVYVFTFNSPEPRVMVEHTLEDYLSPEDVERFSRELKVYGEIVTTPQELEKFRDKFKRNKPIFRVAESYLRGDQIESVTKLRQSLASLDAKIVYQGGTISHEVKVNLGLSDAVNSFISKFTDRKMISIISLITSLAYCTTFEQAVSIATLFIQAVPEVEAAVLARLRSIQALIFQGVGEFFWKTVKEGADVFWQIIAESTIISLMAEFPVVVKEYIGPLVQELVGETRKALCRETALGLARDVISRIKDFYDRLKACYDQGSMDPLYGKSWNYKYWIKIADGLRNYYSVLSLNVESSVESIKDIERLKRTGDIEEYWTVPADVQTYLARVDTWIEQGDRLVSYYSKSIPITNDVSRTLAMLKTHRGVVFIGTASCTERVCPFGLFVYGVPGGGKTTIVNQLLVSMASKFGYSSGLDGIYDWVPNANFQDALTQAVWAIRFDDCDHNPGAPVQGVSNHVENIIRVINSAPFNVEKADVAMKGKVRATPSFVPYITNFKDGNASTQTHQPGAFWRRFNYYVKVSPKLEFATPAGQLDKDKAATSDTHDMFIIEVSEFGGINDARNLVMINTKVLSLSEFFAFFLEKYEVYLKGEVLRILSLKNAKHCKFCSLPLNKTCCARQTTLRNFVADLDVIEQGGVVWSKPLSVESDFQLYIEYFSHACEGECPPDRTCIEFCLAEEICHSDVLDVVEYPPSYVKRYFSKLDPSVQEDFILLFTEGFQADLRKSIKRTNRVIRESIQGCAETNYTAISNSILVGLAGVGVICLAVKYLSATVEEHLEARERNGDNTSVPATFERAEQKFVPGMHAPLGNSTFTYDDIARVLAQSWIRVLNPKTDSEVNGFVLTQNSFVTVTHLANIGDIIHVIVNGTKVVLQLTTMNYRVVPSSPDLVIIISNNMKGGPGIRGKLWLEQDRSVQSFDELELWTNQRTHFSSRCSVRTIRGVDVIMCDDILTTPGDCGTAYLVKFNNTWRIVAFHYARLEKTNMIGLVSNSIMGGILTQGDLDRILSSLTVLPETVVIVQQSFTKVPEDLQVGRFGGLSEVNTVLTYKPDTLVHPIGTMCPPLPGSTMKTKITPSLFYADCLGLEREFCGSSPYWVQPQFRGRMVGEKPNDKWVSSYTNMFEHNNRVQMNDELVMIAIYDYLHGIDKLDTSGYAILTENETIVGVPNSTIRSVNMNTSIGPPYCRGKKAYIVVDDDLNAYMDEKIFAMVDEIEQILSAGQIPSCVALCSQKDEPVKMVNGVSKMPRIFNNMPFALNFVMKRYGVFKSFMRNNPHFFESMVGINMTSSEYNSKVFAKLEIFGSDFYTGDVAMMDKSFNGDIYEAVAKVIYAMSFVIGCDPHKARQLCLSMKFTVYYVKGDLFIVFNNPSGNDWTVEINGIAISIIERVVWYLRNPYLGDMAVIKEWYKTFYTCPVPVEDDKLTFRKNNVLETYGDDNIKACTIPVPPTYEKDWLEQSGFEMTDSAKDGSLMRVKTKEEADFLKRSPVYLPEAQRYVGALSKKSLARMLLWKKDSILSVRDHGATVANEFLREAVYHGKEFYERMSVFILELVKKHGVDENPYFVYKPFDFWINQIVDDSFQTWSTRPSIPRSEVGEDYVIHFQMKSTNLAEASNFEATTGPSEVQFPTGVIGGTAPMTQSISKPANSFQVMPKTELATFMMRPVLCKTMTMSVTDTALTNLDSFSPWQEFFSVDSVERKIADFTLFRGTIQVVGVVTAPPASYGSYVVSALPFGGTTAAVAPLLNPLNCMQVDHSILINLSSSKNFVFQLKWIDNIDYGTITDVIKLWTINLTCLRHVQTSIPGGTSTAKIQFYINLMDDLQMVVPHFESGKIQANHALKQLAPNLHDKIGDGKGSAIVGKVAGVLEMMEKVPMIGAFAQPLASAARVAEGVMNFFGFTREPEEKAPMPISSRSVSNLARGDGPDSSDVAGLTLGNAITIDPVARGFEAEDPLSCPAFFNKWTIVQNFAWATTDGVGAVLGTIPVTPSYAIHSTIGLNPALSMTTAGYYGLTFTFWRGTMEYRLIIPVSKMHRGVLQFIWVPTGSSPIGEVTNTSLNVIHDIASGQSVDLTVGYADKRPYLENLLWSEEMAIVPVGSANGFLSIKVVNPLMAQDASAATSIIVLARGGSDMDFALLRDQVRYIDGEDDPKLYTIRTSIHLQSGAMGDQDDDLPIVYELVPKAALYPSADLLFGEQVNSIRLLLQKPCRLDNMSVGLLAYMIPPLFFTPGYNIISYFTYTGYFRACFIGLASSEVFKFLPKEACWVGAYPTWLMAGYDVNMIGTLAPMTFCGPNKGAEIRVPYYDKIKFTRGTENITSYLGRYNSLNVRPETGTETNVIVYHSCGPDIGATMFRQLPRVTFKQIPLAADNWY